MTEPEIAKRLESAILAARQGNRAQAYLTLRQVLDADPDNVVGWLWFAGVTDLPREARVALKRVQQLDPENPRLAEARAWVERQPEGTFGLQPQEGTEGATTAESLGQGSEVSPVEIGVAAEVASVDTPHVSGVGPEDVSAMAGFTAMFGAPPDTSPGEESSAEHGVRATQPARPMDQVFDEDLVERATSFQGDSFDRPDEDDSGIVEQPTEEPFDQPASPGEDTETSPRESSLTEPEPAADQDEMESETSGEPPESGPEPPTLEPSPPPPQRRGCGRAGRWLIPVIVLLLLVVLLVYLVAQRAGIAGAHEEVPVVPSGVTAQPIAGFSPALRQAVAEGRWLDALVELEEMRAHAPQAAFLDQDTAYVTFRLAVEQRQAGNWDAALESLTRTLALAPDHRQAALEQEHLLRMTAARRLLDAGAWEEAIAALTPVYREDASFGSVTDMLYTATCNVGAEKLAEGDLPAARQAYMDATWIRPKDVMARDALARIQRKLFPEKRPTALTTTDESALVTAQAASASPDPVRQRIEIDISDQRMYVFQDDRLIWDWQCSTGQPGQDTVAGSFTVQSKLEMAYAGTWDLDMPNWLGIYQSGPLENGIHALPIQRSTGTKLWEGYLGQPVSFGCVILSDENSRRLYEWAQVGTPVEIRP